MSASAQSSSPPSRWQAIYTQLYFDDIETVAPALGPAFVLEGPGSLTSQPSEVISGKTSIKAEYLSSSSNPPFLQTNGSVLSLNPNHTYTVSFQYKILIASSGVFYVQFLSFAAASQQAFLKGAVIQGAAGATGTITLTSTLGNYSDYVVYWGTGGNTTGAISIDNIQITDAATGKVLVFEDAEGMAPGPKAGIQFGNATVVSGSQALSGNGSIQISNPGSLKTNAAALPLAGNTVYTIRFDYRILSRGRADNLFAVFFEPAGSTDPLLQVTVPPMFKNAATAGTFSSGAQTAGAPSYVLNLSLSAGVSLIIDNIYVYRQDVTLQAAAPATWSRLLTLPFPRLGVTPIPTDEISSLALDEKAPFTYSVDEIERRIAFSDVIGEVPLYNQTQNPDSIHRLRALNPNAVILPSKDLDLQGKPATAAPTNSNVDLEAQLSQSSPIEWKATTTDGTVIFSQDYPGNYFMNVSDFVPDVKGQTWLTALQSLVTGSIFPSGLWDGISFSSLRGMIDPQMPHYDDPAQFNYDWNRNGQRDETLAATSEMLRAAAVKTLGQINSSANGSQLVMGHTDVTELALAPLVNGYSFECINQRWVPSGATAGNSPARWRTTFDGFLRMQETERAPQINILEGCGVKPEDGFTFTGAYLTPTADDFPKLRFTMGTALLTNGFYHYDLKDTFGAPYWFDEYTVDASGTAGEDPANKGYLGHPLSDAVELTTPATLVFEEGFEGSAPPSSFSLPGSGAFISHNPGEVISGNGSLVVSNPDHTTKNFVNVSTNPTVVPLTPGVQYLLTLDWRILESLDQYFWVSVFDGKDEELAEPPAFVTGDSGTLRFPFVAPSGASPVIHILLYGGGGKIAIDNITLYSGGVGPWRRDFENGFVLVNPLGQPHAFSASELTGSLSRTGIRRIKGTQAPDINNGLPVSGDLTVGAFDAIILLADRIPVRTPAVSSAITAGGFPDIAQNSWIEIRGTDLAPAGVANGLSWSQALSFESGIMPTELGGVRVTVNGKPAFIYFVSQNQVNVLSPLDNTTGPIQIVVTSGGVSGAPFTVTLRDAAPSFPLAGLTRYVVATHADYSLIGPPSLSTPGYIFTPAQAGETITLYAFGLGLPTSPLVDGASIQSGSLPVLPQVQIGGAAATVSFAGLIGPGLYQLNVIVPSGIPSGDSSVTLTYNGQRSPSGDIVAIQ